MTNPRESDQRPDNNSEPIGEESEEISEELWEEDPPQKWPRLVGLGVGGLVLLGIVGGVGYGWYWVHNSLGPTVAAALSKTLNRPLDIGPVERVSLNSIRFGPSGLPATETDPDRATVEAVEVKFNPVDVIDNEINLDLTLINPQVYLEQNAQQEWAQLEITEEEAKEGAFKINVIKAGVENGTVVMVPWKGDKISLEDSVTFKPIRASAEFFDQYNRIPFDVTVAQDGEKGEAQATGEFLNQEQRVNVQLRSQNVDLTAITPLISDIPPEIELTSGKVNGNINGQINLQDIQASSFNGTLLVSEIAGQYTLPDSVTPDEETTDKTETAETETTEAPAFDIANIPLNLSQGQMTIQLQDQLALVEEGSILYADAIPIQLEGGVHLQQGIEFIATLPPVTIEKISETIQTELPITATGEFQVKAKLQGPFEQLIVIGLLETTKPTQIDQVEFEEISTEFAYADSVFAVQNLKLLPTLGGEIIGQGELQFPTTEPGTENSETENSETEEPTTENSVEENNQENKQPAQPFLAFEAKGENVPVEALARLYKIPTDRVNIGVLSPRIQVLGPLNDLQAIARTSIAGGEIQAAGRLIGFDPVGASSTNSEGEDANANKPALPTPPIPLQIQAEIQAQNIQLRDLSAQVPPQLAAPFSGGAQVIIPLDNFTPDKLQALGEGQLNLAGGEVNISARLENNQIASLIQANQVQLGQFRSELEQIVPPEQFQLPFAEAAPFTGVIEIAGPADNFNPNAFQGRLQGRLGLAGGIINTGGVLEAGQWEAALDINQVQVSRLSPQLQSAAQEQAILQTPLTATVNLKGPIDNFSPNAIIAEAKADLDVAGGRVNVIGQAINGGWKATLRADRVRVEQLSPQVPAGFQGPFSGVANAQGRLDDVSPNSILAEAQGFLNVGGGLVNVEAIVQQGQWQARANAEQVQLGQLGLDLPPELQPLTSAAQMVAQGRLDNFDLSAIEAKAEVLLSKLPVLEQGPFVSRMAWNGRSLQIEEASAPGLRASGQILPDFQNLLASRFNLVAQVEDFNLATLPFALPDSVALQGRVDFAGRIAGTGLAPNVDGQVRLKDVVVNQIAFDPLIEGPLQYSSDRGTIIALKGESDEISAVIGPTFIPDSFTFKIADAIATGKRTPATEGSALTNFQVDVAQFPLDLVNLIPMATANPLGPVSGQLSGNFNLSLPTDFTNFDPLAVIAQGEIQVDKPKVGTVEGELLTAKLDYAGGQGTLTDTQLTIGESQYEVDGAVDLNNLEDPQFEAEVKIAQGSVQDILQALQIFDLEDIAGGLAPPIGRAADLGTLTVGESAITLEDQLRRLSEIIKLQDLRQTERDRFPIPTLAQLQGAFDGEIKVSGSLNKGLSADIDLLGENWVWGKYSFNPIIVKGSLQDNVLTLLPVRINSSEGLITFSGQVGGEQQSGQLKIEDVPVGLIQQFIPDLPVDVTGTINSTATLLGGSLENPQVIGKVSISDGTLNETPIQEATGNFSLSDGRLRLGGKMLVTGESPITLTGSIPSPLPIGSVSPISQDIKLDLNLENDGLAILNVLTDRQVSWISGTGNVNIKVSGTLDNPIAVGEAAIADATLESQTLSEPVQNVNGIVKFDGEKVLVENMNGDFSKGKIEVSGLIPLSDPNIPLSEEELQNLLTVKLEEIDLNFQDIYNGGVNGDVTIGGSALEPVLQGNIILTEGKIFVAEATKLQEATTVENIPSDNSFVPNFDQFQIDLTDGIAILQPGFVDIRGEGTLTINGPLDDIRADGVIDINRGLINIISTQFRVNREYDNKARFIPSQGLDPDVDLVLEASISEVQGSRQAETLFWRQPEIDDTPPIDNNNSETVRIQAYVTGPASQLENNLELTSSPVRSRSEIIALIGGGFLNTIGGGGNTTLALANLAGSTILSNLQTSLGEALGLTELRLYPTEDGTRQGAIGLAGEATLDVTKKFSTSIGKTLTSSDPARLRLRYRLSENLILRGATDLGGEQSGRRSTDSRLQFEYRKRF